MKQSVNKYDFSQAFDNMNRGDNFTMQGRDALFEYLEEYEQDCETEIELDVIALCCDYSEHESALDCCNDLGYDNPEPEDTEESTNEEAALEYLRENTQVIVFDEGIIIQGF